MAGPCWNMLSRVIRSELAPPEVQLDLFQRLSPSARPIRPTGGAQLLAAETVALAGMSVAVDFVRHPKARVYRLMLRRDGTARVTLPRYGSLGEARNFLLRHTHWLAERARKQSLEEVRAGDDASKNLIRFRGERVPVVLSEDGRTMRIGATDFPVPRIRNKELAARADEALKRLAARELPERVRELAALHGVLIKQVSVRGQRTRWGSCSSRGLVSLNWRLVQVPESVRDYIILHELAHRKHLNHSMRFWAEVARLCPDYETAEKWLRENGRNIL
jgi:predicted metal-dependent hydrolase